MSTERPARSSPLEVLRVSLRLGCTCFGGPAAHLGYFRTEFVDQRCWFTEAEYAELIALAQTLPGPASSQVGFMAGLLRAGWLGGIAAWVGFTLPSATLMVLFAAFGAELQNGTALAVLHTLQVMAVAVIAQAILAMQKTLAPDAKRLLIAGAAAPVALFAPPAVATSACIVFGAALGLLFLRGLPMAGPSHALHRSISRRSAVAALITAAALFVLLPVAAWTTHNHGFAVASGFFRSGTLIFGGGHVMLPLLQATTVQSGWLDQRTFLSGYGAVQAMPGPLFSFAAFLGYRLNAAPNGLTGAALCLVLFFLPGMLLGAGALPFWARFSRIPGTFAALAGINAAVIGVLAAALYKPGWTTAIHGPGDFLQLLLMLVALLRYKLQPWKLLLGVIALTLLFARLGWMH